MFAPVRTVDPTGVVVDSADFKDHARITGNDDDSLIDAYLRAATDHLDGWSGVLGRAILSQTWRQDYDGWAERLRLPMPASSITSVTYYDSDGSEQTVSSSLYALHEDRLGSYVRLKDAFTEPTLDDDRDAPISVTFVAGYGTASDVPWSIKQAIMLLASHWYENREQVVVGVSVASLPMAFSALVAPYRRIGP